MKIYFKLHLMKVVYRFLYLLTLSKTQKGLNNVLVFIEHAHIMHFKLGKDYFIRIKYKISVVIMEIITRRNNALMEQ